MFALFSCSGSSESGGGAIEAFPIIVQQGIPIILTFDDAGDLWQWEKDETGQPLNPKRIDVKNPVDAGFLTKSAWVRTANNEVFVWEFDKPNEMTKKKSDKGILKSVNNAENYAFLYSDGTVQANLYGCGEWKNIEDIAIYERVLIGLTKEGEVKLLENGNTYNLASPDSTTIMQRVGSFGGGGSSKGYLYAVDDKDYFHFITANLDYSKFFRKSAEPSVCFFDNFLLEKDGDIVEMYGKKAPDWEIPIPDSVYFFRRVGLKDNFHQARYDVGLDGSFSYTPINYVWVYNTNLTVTGRAQLPEAGETKTIEGVKLNTSIFQ